MTAIRIEHPRPIKTLPLCIWALVKCQIWALFASFPQKWAKDQDSACDIGPFSRKIPLSRSQKLFFFLVGGRAVKFALGVNYLKVRDSPFLYSSLFSWSKCYQFLLFYYFFSQTFLIFINYSCSGFLFLNMNGPLYWKLVEQHYWVFSPIFQDFSMIFSRINDILMHVSLIFMC